MFVATRVISEKPPVPKRNIGLPQVTTRDLSPASFVLQYLAFHQSLLLGLLLLISVIFLAMSFYSLKRQIIATFVFLGRLTTDEADN